MEQHPPRPTQRTRFHTQRRLSVDQIAKLVDGYRSGKTMKELASEFGIHRTTSAPTSPSKACPSVAEDSTKDRQPKPSGSTRKAGLPGGWARGSTSAPTRCSTSFAGPGHRSGPDAAGHPARRDSSRAEVRDPYRSRRRHERTRVPAAHVTSRHATCALFLRCGAGHVHQTGRATQPEANRGPGQVAQQSSSRQRRRSSSLSLDDQHKGRGGLLEAVQKEAQLAQVA